MFEGEVSCLLFLFNCMWDNELHVAKKLFQSALDY